MQEEKKSPLKGALIQRWMDPRSTVLDEEVTEPLAMDEILQPKSLRPQSFADYPGQKGVIDNLQIYVEAAKSRQQAMDHVLLYGPPGLGKTSLAKILAAELGVDFVQTSGPAIDKPGDVAGLISGLSERSVLFIDEIHRLSIYVEEVLYSAMEDFEIDIMIGKGATARSMKLPVQPFTLVGATTRVAMLSQPLINRFGIKEAFRFYEAEVLADILLRSAGILDISITADGAFELARRSRGTPRIANRLLRRVRDFAEVQSKKGASQIDTDIVRFALERMQIDQLGLEDLDRKLILTIYERYNGGPVGLETLSHTLGEDKSTLEDFIEPFLVHLGLLQRGPRGRELTTKALEHLKSLGAATVDWFS